MVGMMTVLVGIGMVTVTVEIQLMDGTSCTNTTAVQISTRVHGCEREICMSSENFVKFVRGSTGCRQAPHRHADVMRAVAGCFFQSTEKIIDRIRCTRKRRFIATAHRFVICLMSHSFVKL